MLASCHFVLHTCHAEAFSNEIGMLHRICHSQRMLGQAGILLCRMGRRCLQTSSRASSHHRWQPNSAPRHLPRISLQRRASRCSLHSLSHGSSNSRRSQPQARSWCRHSTAWRLRSAAPSPQPHLRAARHCQLAADQLSRLCHISLLSQHLLHRQALHLWCAHALPILSPAAGEAARRAASAVSIY